MRNRSICIPLSASGGYYGNDFELRYVLRSIAALWQGPIPDVHVWGARPAWASRTLSSHAIGSSQWEARKRAGLGFNSNSLLWWMDDCFLLKRSTWEQFELPRASGNLVERVTRLGSPNVWAQGLVDVAGRLAVEGRSCLDFSTPHAPYVCTGTHMYEACLEWGDSVTDKFPIESWLLNDGRRAQDASDVETRFFAKGDHPPAPAARLLVLTDRSLPPMRRWLEARFPRKSPWEK